MGPAMPTDVTATRQKLVDRVLSAPTADDQRSEALDAIEQAGNFLVYIERTSTVVTVARLVKYLRDTGRRHQPGEVTPC